MACTPPPHVFGDIDLPGTRLHYVRCGEGPPLIIVPATVSLIGQWLPLAQFMGQRYTTYFFELPGHGGSTPYPQDFESRLVPPTVEAFVDAMGHERFHLMGFSFGGLLALRTLEALQRRIDSVFLLSPCVSQRALKFSLPRRVIFKTTAMALKNTHIRWGAHRVMNAPQFETPLTYALSSLSRIDRRILKSKNALHLPLSTLDVFAHTLGEILDVDYRPPGGPFRNPCYFGMSVHDDLLDYTLTEQLVRNQFTDLTIQKFYHPYHQPPHPPTFDWLVEGFGRFLDMIPSPDLPRRPIP